MHRKYLLLVYLLILVAFMKNDNLETTQVTVTTISEYQKALKYYYKNYTPQFRITYLGEKQDMVSYSDGKEAFFNLSDEMELRNGSVKALLSQLHVRYSYTDDIVRMDFSVRYATNKLEVAHATYQAALVAGAIRATTKNPYLQLKLVNDYVMKRTVYDEHAKNSHAAYGVFKDGRAVCQGYAHATYLILHELGYDVLYVSGIANDDTPHAWNLVKLDNHWYHLDVTFNDTGKNKSVNQKYRYFLKSDNAMSYNHEWVRSLYPISNLSYLERTKN